MSSRSSHLNLERSSPNLLMTSDDDSVSCRTDVSDLPGYTRPSLSTRFKLLVRADVCKIFVKATCCDVKDLHTNLSSCSVWRTNGWPLSLAERGSAITQMGVRAFLVASSLCLFLQRKNSEYHSGKGTRILGTHNASSWSPRIPPSPLSAWHTCIDPDLMQVRFLAVLLLRHNFPQDWPNSFYPYLLKPRIFCHCLFSSADEADFRHTPHSRFFRASVTHLQIVFFSRVSDSLRVHCFTRCPVFVVSIWMIPSES